MSKAKLKKKIYSYGEGRKLELIFNEFIKVNILFVNGCTFVIEGRYITEDSALVDSKSVLEENFIEKKGYYHFNLNKEVYSYKDFKIELSLNMLQEWSYKVYSKNGSRLHKQSVGGFGGKNNALNIVKIYIDKLDKSNREDNNVVKLLKDLITQIENEDIYVTNNIVEYSEESNDKKIKYTFDVINRNTDGIKCLPKDFNKQRNVIENIDEDLTDALERFENEQEVGALTVNSVSELLKEIGYKVLYLKT